MIDRKTLAKHIQTELGAPVIEIELTKEQIDHCIDRADFWVESTGGGDLVRRRYASAMAKLILGRIRSKYTSIPGPGDDMSMDGRGLITDASSEFTFLGAGPYG
jgi:hypothetical protein